MHTLGNKFNINNLLAPAMLRLTQKWHTLSFFIAVVFISCNERPASQHKVDITLVYARRTASDQSRSRGARTHARLPVNAPILAAEIHQYRGTVASALFLGARCQPVKR